MSDYGVKIGIKADKKKISSWYNIRHIDGSTCMYKVLLVRVNTNLQNNYYTSQQQN
jgi:hypothetical protein